MNECEKRDMGLLYDANNNKELLYQLDDCKSKCFKYNKINPKKHAKRNKFLKKIIQYTKVHYLIQSPFWCDYGYNIELGENFYANHGLIVLDAAKVSFGDNVFIGPNCGFYTAGHPLNKVERNQGLEYAKPIKVGNSVWFGGGVLVMPGVTIGDNVVIGAGSVVTKDIPSNVVACGVPCKIIKKIEET